MTRLRFTGLAAIHHEPPQEQVTSEQLDEYRQKHPELADASDHDVFTAMLADAQAEREE